MIIDFHTHIFSDYFAEKAMKKMTENANLPVYTNGTSDGLKASMRHAGIDLCVILPVATKPGQTEILNACAIDCNANETKLRSFGALHPENENYKEILDRLQASGIRGIKLHPVFQHTFADDIRYKHIVDYAAKLGLYVLFHAGKDAREVTDYASPDRLVALYRDVPYDRIILAHMGGWSDWENAYRALQDPYSAKERDASEKLADCYKGYLDTAFCLGPTHNFLGDMPRELFLQTARLVGADRLLFGTDSPWTDQKQALEYVIKSGLSQAELAAVLGKNAEKILG